MKRFLKTMGIFLCLLICFISGCNKNTREEISSNRVIFFRDGGTYSESYALFTNSGPRCYYDVESGNEGPYCFEAGCEHKRSVHNDNDEVIQQGCLAYDYTDYPIFLCGDYLYFFSSRSLYRADRKGNNREKLAELTSPYELNGACCYYTQEAFYIAYTMSYEYSLVENSDGVSGWRVGARREKPESGVLRIPFSGSKEEVIYHSDKQYEMQVVEFWSYDGHVLFMLQSMDRPGNFVDLKEDNWQELVEEERRHTFLEVYDYSVSSGEVKRLVEPRSNIGIYFFSEVYGIAEKEPGSLELFNYNGDRVALTEGTQRFGISSDRGIFGWDNDTGEGVMLDEKNGKIVKRSPFTINDFSISVIVGKSCFGYVYDSEGNYVRAWISTDDFWTGNKSGIRVFPK